jgi:hypothetical protein
MVKGNQILINIRKNFVSCLDNTSPDSSDKSMLDQTNWKA